MDLRKFNKPIHFTCPKCRTDFEFNGGKLAQQKADMAYQITVIKAKMQAHRNEYGKDKYYYSLARKEKELTAEYTKIKKLVQLASEQSEAQLFILFKKECMARFGKEEVIKILKECEQEMSYRTYDMAIQDHNTFDGM